MSLKEVCLDKFVQYSQKSQRRKVTTLIKRQAYKKPAIQKLLEADEGCDALETLRKYYRQFNNAQEDKRFSNLSKEFFNYVKKAFRLNEANKKDGSVISSLLNENNHIITSPNEVNVQLILTLKELQVNLFIEAST